MLSAVYHPGSVVPLPEGHRFPMPKFGLLYDLLVSEGTIDPGATTRPETASREAVQLVHNQDYVDKLLSGGLSAAEERRMGLPWSEPLIQRTYRAVGGTIATARLALRTGLACNTAGGTHHAHPGFGSGFCLLNDLAVTARLLRAEGRVRRVLIVDLDVHQGDGTAAALAGDPDLFTFSMHCGSNFPFRKVAGDRDIALNDHLGDDAYLRELEAALPLVIDAAEPDLILYDAGVDVYVGDRLGRLDLTLNGIARRDRLVIETARACDIPLAAVIGGGYDRDLAALADRHAIVHRVATERRGVV